ncbi:MAG: hypothetical protein RR238_05225 [Lachnospiraceae bacterium]
MNIGSVTVIFVYSLLFILFLIPFVLIIILLINLIKFIKNKNKTFDNQKKDKADIDI